MKIFKFDAQHELQEEILRKQGKNLHACAKAHSECCEIMKREGFVTSFANLDYNSEWFETKNYKWILIEGDGYNCVVRWYSWHLSLIIRRTSREYYFGKNPMSMITIEINRDLLPDDDNDYLVDNPFHILGPMAQIVESKIKENVVHICWCYSEKDIPEEKRVKELTYHPYKHYTKVRVPINGTSLSNVGMMGFMMEEIASLHLNLMCDYDFKEYMRKHKDKCFKIPKGNNEVYIGIIEDKDGNVFVTYIDEKGKTSYEDISRIWSWELDKFYPFLNWID